MEVLFRNPRRTVEIEGPMRVQALLDHFDLHRESVLVISDGTLVPGDSTLGKNAKVEIRPVISGGAPEDAPR